MDEKHRTNLYTYFCALTSSLLMLCIGIVTSWSSPIVFKLQDATNRDNPFGHSISANEASWIGSLNSLGCAAGPIPFGFIASRFGRKPALLIAGFLYFTSFLLLAFVKAPELYYVGRLLAGFAVAGGFTVNPAYASEIAHHQERAKLNLIGTASVFVGLLIPYVVGPYLSIMVFNLFCAIFPLIFLCVFPIFMVESPHYSISKNNHEGALAALRRLRSAPADVIEKEVEDIKHYIINNNAGTLKDLFGSKLLVKCLFLAISLFTFQQFTGLVPLVNYTQNIFEAAGTEIPSDIAAIIFSSVQCVLGFGATFVIPRFRFRTLLICSNIGLVISLGIFGAYFYLKETNLDTSAFGWVPIVFMIGTVVSFMYGAGVLPGIITSEIFPTNLRAMALAIALTIGSTESFLLTMFYSSINDAMGIAGSSWIFAACCAVGLVFDYLFVPETNGKTFQVIQDILKKN